jgi:hypothetical protein
MTASHCKSCKQAFPHGATGWKHIQNCIVASNAFPCFDLVNGNLKFVLVMLNDLATQSN